MTSSGIEPATFHRVAISYDYFTLFSFGFSVVRCWLFTA